MVLGEMQLKLNVDLQALNIGALTQMLVKLVKCVVHRSANTIEKPPDVCSPRFDAYFDGQTRDFRQQRGPFNLDWFPFPSICNGFECTDMPKVEQEFDRARIVAVRDEEREREFLISE